MASTITSATMKVTIAEQIILNGRDQGSKNTLNISGIKDIFKRIITVAADDDATVLVFKSTTASADGALDKDNVKYIRITNLDDSNSVNISLQLDSGEDNSAADIQSTILLEAGKSFMMGSPEDGIGADDDAAGLVTNLVDLDSLVVQPGSNAISVEVFVASA